MSRMRLLDSIHRKEANRVDAQLIQLLSSGYPSSARADFQPTV